MSDQIRAIRGMNDILPEQTAFWQYVERTAADLFGRYGYHELRTPVVEKTTLFERAIGESTDVVEKEMYTFEDRGGDLLSLRPEGTASCVRALLQHGLIKGGQTQKIWYTGPMFRYERPQKGRYRQFHQIGVEAFNLPGPDVDVEIQMMCRDLWAALGVADLRLEINSLGGPVARERYREALVEYFGEHREQLDEDSQRRLTRNPLRILDSKNPDMQALIDEAPKLLDYLDDASRAHFERYCQLLEMAGIEYVINPRLVRGLDYYTDVVFEWTTTQLGAQNAVCSGGRYDGLVETQGGKATPAVGFALGMERLLELMDRERVPMPAPDAYLVMSGELAENQGFALAAKLRVQMPQLALQLNLGGGSLKAQLRRADKSGARWALIIGDGEAQDGNVSVKALRSDEAQFTTAQSALVDVLREKIGD